MKNLFAILMFSLLLTFGVTAFSQTPDGETPAVEDVCDVDGLTGAAWGLCNAYCEAMDCDEEPQASDAACNKVLESFRDETDGNDPPCLEEVCPCWTLEELMEETNLRCNEEPPVGGDCSCEEQIGAFSTLELIFTNPIIVRSVIVKTVKSTGGALSCTESIGRGGSSVNNISQMEYDVCNEQIWSECAKYE